MGDERRILMVDDKVTLCFAMREYFKLYDYQIDCAHTVDDATTRLNDYHYPIMIADLNLGGSHELDGFKVIKMARERCPKTRIIVLTAYGSNKVESVAQDLGVSAFLHKPSPLSEVARIVFELAADKLKD
jgi:Response regulator containing CheY-like receiver, AAA-type ATPase, and DNA-binding domains